MLVLALVAVAAPRAEAACAGCEEYTLSIPRPKPKPEPEPAPDPAPPPATSTFTEPAATSDRRDRAKKQANEETRAENQRKGDVGERGEGPGKREAAAPRGARQGERLLVSESGAGGALWRNLGGAPGLALLAAVILIGLAPGMSRGRR